MNRTNINYSQCWEDPDVLKEALAISPSDTIISITSGGDNTLALLLENPRHITALDLNQPQNYLLDLKLASICALSYKNLLEFLGVTSSSHREKFFFKVRDYLDTNSRSWWEGNMGIINKGVITTGKFERYLMIFRRILFFIHSQSTINQFLSFTDIIEQQKFYAEKWNSKRWKLYFIIATNRTILKLFARQKGMFRFVKLKNIAKIYASRLEKNLTSVPVYTNYFIHYCLIGTYGRTLPPYLEKKNQEIIKKNKNNLTIVTENLITFLQASPPNSFSKFNLSDIFEALSKQQTIQLWKEILRTSTPNARVVYWDNLTSHPIPAMFSNNVHSQQQLADKLFSKDRVFFYGKLYIYDIIK